VRRGAEQKDNALWFSLFFFLKIMCFEIVQQKNSLIRTVFRQDVLAQQLVSGRGMFAYASISFLFLFLDRPVK
jgi:hypothetical protein